ncbi:MAG: hypothetical protein ABI776_00100 [Nocardioidaceae bacterium]
MSEDEITAELTEGERAWPYAGWKLYVGRLLELGDGLRMGLVRVPDGDSCVVQVFRPEAQPDAEMVTLRLDRRVPCKTRLVRLVEADATAARPWVRVLVG